MKGTLFPSSNSKTMFWIRAESWTFIHLYTEFSSSGSFGASRETRMEKQIPSSLLPGCPPYSKFTRPQIRGLNPFVLPIASYKTTQIFNTVIGVHMMVQVHIHWIGSHILLGTCIVPGHTLYKIQTLYWVHTCTLYLVPIYTMNI